MPVAVENSSNKINVDQLAERLQVNTIFYDTCLTFSAMFQCNTQQFSLKISWIIVWDQFNLSLFQKIKWNNQTLERIWYSVSFSWIFTFDLKRKDFEPEIMLDISVTHEPMSHKFPLFRIFRVSLRKWTLSEKNHQCSKKLMGMVIFQELHILQYWSIYRYFLSAVWDLYFDMIWHGVQFSNAIRTSSQFRQVTNSKGIFDNQRAKVMKACPII